MTKKLQYIEESDFWNDMDSKNPELVYEVVNQIIHEIETESKKRKLKIFEVYIKDEYIIDFVVQKQDWFDMLENLLEDMIKYEDYNMCNKIKIICGL